MQWHHTSVWKTKCRPISSTRWFLSLSANPQCDQYRLMQSAVSGFLFQQGCQENPVVRHYLDGLFRKPDEVTR